MVWGDGATRFARGFIDEVELCLLELYVECVSDFEVIMLVVGMIVGGGFLVMLYFVVFAGFVSAVLISCGAWAVFAASGLLVFEMFMYMWVWLNG